MSPTPTDRSAAQIMLDARWIAGLSQAEVARRAGVSQQSIAKYERGARQPSLATLTRLVAGCGYGLAWQLVPGPGSEDGSTLDLLAKAPFERLEPQTARSLRGLVLAAHSLEFVVGGRTAARLRGAVVRDYEIELWVPDAVDLDELTAYLARAGVEYVSAYGDSGPAIPSRASLFQGWPLVAPGADVHLRSMGNFDLIQHGSSRLELPDAPGSTRVGSTPVGTLLVASMQDCSFWWHGRDEDQLALQRAVRLGGAAVFPGLTTNAAF